jgi:hypothetical protein
LTTSSLEGNLPGPPLRVYVLAYRAWALPVVESIRRHPRVTDVQHFTNNQDYVRCLHNVINCVPTRKDLIPDVVVYVGWSSDPDGMLVTKIPHVGVHCAESDVYSGGTPLQNQIIDGITRTKHRIFKVWYPELSLREWSHEVDLDLSGGMDDILGQMTSTSISLFNEFLDDWPHITWKTWPAVDASEMRPGRRPHQSVLSKDDLNGMNTRQLYNFFRCLGDPYPNGCIEDGQGRLYVEKVRFKAR